MLRPARWLRPAEASPELRSLASRLNGLTLLATFGWGAFAVGGVVLGVRADAVFLPIVVVALAVLRPIVLRARTESTMRVGAMVVGGLNAVVLTGWTIYNGPVAASPAEYLALLPLA